VDAVESLLLGSLLILGLPVLAVHMLSVMLTSALRSYSRSRLEAICTRRGHPELADEVAHHDERTERSAEALAVLAGLTLAALLGANAARLVPEMALELVVAIALTIGAIGYVTAGILGRVFAEVLIDRLWPLARPLRAVMSPLTSTARLLEALIYRTARRSALVPRPASVEVEIHSAPEGQQENIEADLPDATREILEHVVELTRRDVSEIMTPRAAMLTLPATVSADEAARAFRDSGFSRIPLFGENRDDIVGILYAKDLLAALTAPDHPEPPIPRKLMRPPFAIPETKNAAELLDELRLRRTHLAIVLDEYGGVSGLVTLEDLLEELVGPIHDEHDAPPRHEPIVALGDARYEVDAALDIEEFNEHLGLSLPTNGDYQTIGGLTLHILGRLPAPGDSFRFEGIDFTVTEVGEHAIRRIRIDLQPDSEPIGSSYKAEGGR
jgi:CBS domain containing-hemolysin-like protein